ncbi:hypothetical protein CCUS01_13588 [Colletotrichum cuscutae]|uniref:Uncharacterized protein n=1 Tax=Colletotrichum cuscutae TaxID=1209917 RepID=A0AAJ0DNA2_9PEZI|nr:hypothetical protein CCUS01_13588 [Colletotrichum cuscutae]
MIESSLLPMLSTLLLPGRVRGHQTHPRNKFSQDEISYMESSQKRKETQERVPSGRELRCEVFPELRFFLLYGRLRLLRIFKSKLFCLCLNERISVFLLS